jgi:hypothetical protein
LCIVSDMFLNFTQVSFRILGQAQFFDHVPYSGVWPGSANPNFEQTSEIVQECNRSNSGGFSTDRL